MHAEFNSTPQHELEALHEIGARIAAADPLQAVLRRVLDFACAVAQPDSCFVYVVDTGDLVLRASKNPHADVIDRLKLRMGQGITGWVAEHKVPVAIPRAAALDPRFEFVRDLPEDAFEAFLSVPILCRNKLVGVINLQHRQPHDYSRQEVRLISMVGFLVGPEIEMARLEAESARSVELDGARQLVERANGILRRNLQISQERAGAILQNESRARMRSVKEVAEAILMADEIERAARSAPQPEPRSRQEPIEK
jgi:signal transduction protein with GAF and PtsI domain